MELMTEAEADEQTCGFEVHLRWACEREMMGTRACGPSMLWMQMLHASPVDNWGTGARLMPSEALMVLSCRVGTGPEWGLGTDRDCMAGYIQVRTHVQSRSKAFTCCTVFLGNNMNPSISKPLVTRRTHLGPCHRVTIGMQRTEHDQRVIRIHTMFRAANQPSAPDCGSGPDR